MILENIKKLTNPETIKTKFLNSLYFDILKQYKNFNGRTTRNEFWFFILINILISIILSILWGPLSTLFLIGALVPSIALSVRRVHDLNKESWFALIPFYNLYLFIQKGTNVDQPNVFGGPLEDNRIKTNFLFILIGIIFILFISKTSFQQYLTKKAQEKREALYTSNDTASINTELEKSNQASLKEVENAQTLEEIIVAFRNAPRGSQASLTAALKWIDLCQTSKELKDANDNFSEFSEAKTKVLKKWLEVSKKELEQTQTVQTAKEVYNSAPDDNDLKTSIYNKWNDLSLKAIDQIKTVKEAKELYDNSPIGSQARTRILEKWKESSNTEIEKVQNFEDTKTLFGNLPDDITIKNNAISRWISFCQTVVQAKEVYSNAIDKSDPKRLVLAKWKELAANEITQIQNVSDAKTLFDNLPPDDDKLESNLIIKWISLCQTAVEVKEVYSKTLINSEEQAIAFEKWNTLSLQEIEKVQTLEEVKTVYNNTPENSQARTVAKEKLRQLQ